MIAINEFNIVKSGRILFIVMIAVGVGLFLISCGKDEPSRSGAESGVGVSGETQEAEDSGNAGSDGEGAVSEPVQARLADAMVKGTRYHGVSIKADRFDPVSGMIYGVRVTAEGYLLSADHAEIVVNYGDETARLILYDAVSVAVPTYSEEKITGNDEGEMTTYERLELEPFSIKN